MVPLAGRSGDIILRAALNYRCAFFELALDL